MERFSLILAVAIASGATRIAGFTLDRRAIPRRLDRAPIYVPIAAFAVLLTRQLWATLLAGMAVYWLMGSL